MICVVLPAAHSALDLYCLHSHINYSILHWLLCCTLYWIFSLVQFSLLTFNICLDLMVESPSCLYCCLVWFFGVMWIMEFVLSAYSSLLCIILRTILRLTFCKCYLLKALFVTTVFQLPSSTELWRYCPVCVNFMRGKHRDWAICEEIGVKSTYLQTRLPLEPFCDQLFMYWREPRNYI